MTGGEFFSSWVEVDLGAIKNNVRSITQHTGVQVMSIVKANAYGHGAVPVSQAALDGGATWLGVARVSEAIELRQAGFGCPILLLGAVPEFRLEEVISNRISITVWTVDQAQMISSAAERVGRLAGLHLKVDTGMSRLGAQIEEVSHLVQQIKSYPAVHLEGLFTHFACADESDKRLSDKQERLFRQVLSELERDRLHPMLVHAANSAASLTRPSANFDLVRFGIAMYGLHPSPDECRLPAEFRPALTWKAVLSQVKILPPGRGVSYGHIYTTSRNERIGTVAVGYADGFRRIAGNHVLVGGVRVPVVGRVCMDQITIQLDSVPGAKAGDEVVLVGNQGQASITAEDVARVWGTINYEVVCDIGARVARFYH